jgi:hypothetical protein
MWAYEVRIDVKVTANVGQVGHKTLRKGQDVKFLAPHKVIYKNTMAKINANVKSRAMQWLQDVNSEFDSLTSRLRPKWYDWWRLYRVFENEQRLPGQSNIFIPKVFEVIEKKVPSIVKHNPKFIVSARVNEAADVVAIARETLDYWWYLNKMRAVSEKFVKDGFIFGIASWKVDWKQEFKKKIVTENGLDEETGETISKEVEELEVVSEHPTAKVVSIFDFKIDPRVETFQEGVGILHFINDVRWAQLWDMKDDYDLSELKDVDVESLDADISTTPEKEEQEDDRGIESGATEIDKNRMTICDFWGLFSPSGKPEDEQEYHIVAVVRDGMPEYVIKCEVNDLGFRPFVKFADRVVNGEFYAIGEVEPLEGLQIEYNNIRNARMDFNNSVNYPEWIYNRNANINPAQLVHKPNNIIPVDLPLGSDVTSVLRPLDKPIAPVSGINEEAQINKDFQTVSQTIDYTDRGGSKGFTNTATGIQSRDAQMNAQVSNVVDHLEDAISELGMMWLALADKFGEDKIMIRRKRAEEDFMQDEIPLSEVEDKFTVVDKSVFTDALFKYGVQVEAGSTTYGSAQGKGQDAVNLANTAVQFASMGVPIDMTRIFKELIKENYHKSNPEEYILQQQPQMPGQPGGNPMPSNPAQPGGKALLQPSQPNQQLV